MEYFFSAIVVLAILAFIYLLVGALGVNELLPKTVSGFLIKLSTTIILTAITLAVYDLLGIAVFGKISAGVFIAGLIFSVWTPVFERIARAHRKRYGSIDPKEGWICRSCGEENAPLFSECARCKHNRHEQRIS